MPNMKPEFKRSVERLIAENTRVLENVVDAARTVANSVSTEDDWEAVKASDLHALRVAVAVLDAKASRA